MKYKCIFLLLFVLVSCDQQPDKCLSKEGPALMVHNKFEYAEIVRRDYGHYEEVKSFLRVASLTNNLASRLVEQTGGISQEAELINSCTVGEAILNIYSKAGFIERVNSELNNLKNEGSFNWNEWKGIKILFDDTLLNESSMKTLMREEPLGHIILKLMLIENKIYSQIMLTKNPCTTESHAGASL